MILLNWIVKRCLEESEEYWKIQWLLPLFAKAEEEPFDPATNAFADSQLQDFCCWFRAREQGRGVWNQVTPRWWFQRFTLGKNIWPIWNQCSLCLSIWWADSYDFTELYTHFWNHVLIDTMRAVVVHFFVPSWKSGCSEAFSPPQAASRCWQGIHHQWSNNSVLEDGTDWLLVQMGWASLQVMAFNLLTTCDTGWLKTNLLKA